LSLDYPLETAVTAHRLKKNTQKSETPFHHLQSNQTTLAHQATIGRIPKNIAEKVKQRVDSHK
jgi:hypothetical protein